MNIAQLRDAYLIGIKGAGMTALAIILRERGVRVTGSDVPERFATDAVLAARSIPVHAGFAASHVPPTTDVVIRSTAYGDAHVEVQRARLLGRTVLTYPEAVASLFNSGRGIAVCGSHGKSTTTALLGFVLAAGGYDPTVIVGAVVPQFEGNARVGHSAYVVLEADEYQNKLAHYQPFGVILTNIEYDHPDFFPTPASYVDAFRAFVRRIPADGFLVACTDDPVVADVVRDARCAVIPYGRSQGVPEDLHLQLVGAHNAENALGVLAAALHLGMSRTDALAAIAAFTGTRRRFEIIGTAAGSTVIDDYGHHPSEIRATLAAARTRYPGQRILCAFHAHTFSRTVALKDGFAAAFRDADQTYVMDIFGSAREPHGGITAAELAAAIAVQSPAVASGNVAETTAVLLRDVRPGDVVICMGAGENDHVARNVVTGLQMRASGDEPMRAR
ncbi:UDP-N-acetylmuramate--L-alanine ligase [Candidatus Uhrbacteria bacterium]|nr:UDP-N-acetylmuramate--L-alanine ligase [Candidatus Uhrbacteria bacterium]